MTNESATEERLEFTKVQHPDKHAQLIYRHARGFRIITDLLPLEVATKIKDRYNNHDRLTKIEEVAGEMAQLIENTSWLNECAVETTAANLLDRLHALLNTEEQNNG